MPEDLEVRDLLLAMVALLADEREERIGERPRSEKTEVLLASCGLSASGIATLMGKQPDAVRKTLSRARQRGGTPRAAPGPSDA